MICINVEATFPKVDLRNKHSRANRHRRRTSCCRRKKGEKEKRRKRFFLKGTSPGYRTEICRMVNSVMRYIIFIELLYMLNKATAATSPCPQFFRYTRNDVFEAMGQVEIPSPPKNVALHLKIGLSVATSLPSKYVGRLELAQSREESVKAIQQGRSLFYLVHFPVRRPIPVLTGIWFNNQRYCSGPRASGRVVTSIFLEHTLFPPGILPTSGSQGNSVETRPNFDEFVPPVQDQRPNVITIPLPTQTRPNPSLPSKMTTEKPFFSNKDNTFDTFESSNYSDCGRSSNNNNGTINLLIARGMKTSPGQWPWLVAIFIVKIEFEFQCAGSLVTNKHIITAAHCMKLDEVTLPASTMLVSLGRYRLREWREPGSVNREVEEYRLHPNYKGDYKDQTADSDLAVLILREPVEFSPFIKPVCLWSGSTDLRDIVGFSGYVVGWGRDEFGNPYLAEPRMSMVPIVSQEDCLWSNAGFIAFTSNRTLCGGSRNGSGPCNGDSGSGLVIRNSDGRYQLRGIVSRSILDRTTMSCDLTQFVVYVDVAKHMDWIRTQIAT
ncbi:hypothetical protein KPH14_012519 [Odynerus spinipes]|uniref:Peptidase S1 domain-containing protein n=1 Tax=Odynerus spinipes TaxID=1348599 RepID=A0AAD9RIF8_9HYME|nr:hypothetical protein KPH14_012519 [Odynerus spinipes]